MAAATTAKGKNEAPAIEGMEVEENLNGLSLRGRVRDPQVPLIRAELVKCLGDNTIRSFKDVTTKDREKMARKVRAAGAMKDDEYPEGISTLTRFDEANGKLYWGPESVMKAIGS